MDMPIKEWVEKHFRYTNHIMASENNIAYTIPILGAKRQAMKLGRRGWASRREI